MRLCNVLIVIFALNVILCILATNHWVLNATGQITAKIDSPFFMQEPPNLPSFLEQIKYNDIAESTYLELVRQRTIMVEQINYSIKFGMEVIEQAKCALEFYDAENSLTYTRLTRKYLSRINRKVKYELLVKPDLPHCWRYYNFKAGLCCFDHLPSLGDSQLLQIAPELELKDDELEIGSDYFLSNIVAGLEKNPNSWKYHTLGSYYWRMKGDAHQAVECARRGVLLAPRKFKDIPLLSLGTILWRSEKLNDADIVLTAAADHAGEIPENHLALGITLAMLYDFNRSVEHFDIVERLDSSFSKKINDLKSFVVCLDNLNKKTEKMDSYVEYFRKELNGLRLLKNIISISNEKMIQQMVPIRVRYQDKKLFNHRDQYCSTRTLGGADEAVLVCDYYSDIQKRLGSIEDDIKSLEKEINGNSDAVKKRLSFEFSAQFKFQRAKGKSRKD